MTVKRIKKDKDKVTLMLEKLNYKPIVIEGETILLIWGVVTYAIKNMQKQKGVSNPFLFNEQIIQL